MNMKTHVQVTTYFTSGEVAYLFILVPVLFFNKNQFPGGASPIIDSCVLGIIVVTCVGAAMHMGVPGVSTNQIGEWIAFYTDFFVRFQMARLLKFENVVKRLD